MSVVYLEEFQLLILALIRCELLVWTQIHRCHIYMYVYPAASARSLAWDQNSISCHDMCRIRRWLLSRRTRSHLYIISLHRCTSFMNGSYYAQHRENEFNEIRHLVAVKCFFSLFLIVKQPFNGNELRFSRYTPLFYSKCHAETESDENRTKRIPCWKDTQTKCTKNNSNNKPTKIWLN